MLPNLAGNEDHAQPTAAIDEEASELRRRADRRGWSGKRSLGTTAEPPPPRRTVT